MCNVHPKGSMSFALKLGLTYCPWRHEEVVALFIENPQIGDVQIENSELVTSLMKTLRWGLENP